MDHATGAVIWDRFGRGLSGDTAPYAPEREVEDLRSVVDAAGGYAVILRALLGAVLALLAAGAGVPMTRLFVFERDCPARVQPRVLGVADCVTKNPRSRAPAPTVSRGSRPTRVNALRHHSLLRPISVEMAIEISQVPIRQARPPMITGPLPIPTAVLMIIQITLEIRPASSPLRRFPVMLAPCSELMCCCLLAQLAELDDRGRNDNRHEAPQRLRSTATGPLVRGIEVISRADDSSGIIGDVVSRSDRW